MIVLLGLKIFSLFVLAMLKRLILFESATFSENLTGLIENFVQLQWEVGSFPTVVGQDFQPAQCSFIQSSTLILYIHLSTIMHSHLVLYFRFIHCLS